MEDLDGLRPPLQAAGMNVSRTEGGVSKQTRLLLEVLLVLMCLGAVVGNVLVIAVVAATRTLQAVTSVLILNLAISDLLVGIGVMPFVAMSIMNTRWVRCPVLCLYVGYSSTVYCTVSVLTLTAIALDRYYSIVDCLRYNSRCTLLRSCAVVLWIWFQALVVCSSPLLGWSSVTYVVPMYTCAVTWASTLSYTAFMAALTYLIPAAVILFCYGTIFRVARSHARRIHSLEDSVQRSRSPCAPGDSSHRHCRNLHRPWRVTCRINEELASHVGKKGLNVSEGFQETPTQQRSPSVRRVFSILAQNRPRPPEPNNNQHQHHGAVRLLLIISAFFLCWTPYICVALVQATETALTGQSTLVPDSAVTFSYWLMLLNSDVNPFLYALLSQRFQSALQGLGHKVGAHLWSVLGREWEVRAEDIRNSEPCTLTTAHPSSHSSMESLNCDASKYSSSSSSIFTVCTDFKSHPEVHLCDVCRHENSPSVCRDAACDKTHNLQVPPRPQEGSRLPFSALTKERQATFFFGQITVTVEHDLC